LLAALAGEPTDATIVWSHAVQDRAAAGSHVVSPARVVGKRTNTPPERSGVSRTDAGVQDSRKQEENRSDHLGEGKCTARLETNGCILSGAATRKIEFRIISTCIPIRTLKCQRAPI